MLREAAPCSIIRKENNGGDLLLLVCRLYSVLEDGLQGHDWLANDSYSIADIASFSWVAAGFFAGVLQQVPSFTQS